jgi:zinc transport system substrate-binding protein
VRVILRLIPAEWSRPAILRNVLLVATAIALAACSRSSAAGSAGRLDVVASFYPLAEAAHQVGGSLVSVKNLTAPGVEPHDLGLTPNQLRDISDAEVLLFLGGGFQPAVEDALDDVQGEAVDVSSGLRSLPVPAGESEPALASDPHVWLDPVLYSDVVGKVERAFAKLDPAGAATFSSKAKVFQKQLARLNREFRTGLADCARQVIVTSHAAFGYLSSRYGLEQEAISGISPDAEPTPRHLAELKDLVDREGITTIFTEELVSPKVAETLARETGATTQILNPLESLTPGDIGAGKDYLSVMLENLSKLRTALGCH